MFKFENIIIACIVIYMIFYFIKMYNQNQETLLNIDHSNDDEISKKVYNFLIESKGTYADYITYLKSIKNPNPNLSDMDNYYKLKALQSINGLSKDIILNFMHGKT